MKFRTFFRRIAPVLLAVASFVVPGLPALVGNFVMTAAGSGAVIGSAAASAVGSATLNATVGILSGAKPEQIARNIGSTLLTAGIGAVSSDLGPAGTAAARSAAGAALGGKDFTTVLRSAIAGASGVGLTELTGSQTIGNTASSLLAGQAPEKVAAAAVGGLGRDIQTGAFSAEPPEYRADMEGRPTGAPDTEPGAEIGPQDSQPVEAPTYTDRLAQALQTAPQVYSMLTRPSAPPTAPTAQPTAPTPVEAPTSALASGLGTSAIGGRTVSTLAAAPSGAFRDPSGSIEDVETGGKRRMAWNEASLRLKDALGV